jgi:hypothetical protein
MTYIINYATKHYSDDIIKGLDTKELAKKLDISEKELCHEVCCSCGGIYKEKAVRYNYLCERCGNMTKSEEFTDYIICPKCKAAVRPSETKKRQCDLCKSTEIRKTVNLKLVLGLDEILISPRHLYRMPFSLHEKSGLASLPINPDSVLAFDKKEAAPENIVVEHRFLDDTRTEQGEGSDLIIKAFDFKPEIKEDDKEYNKKYVNVDLEPQEKVPAELFPPCVTNILSGIRDGKKRSVFILVNFLNSLGWEYKEIEEILEVWNKKNEDTLRETNIKSAVNYHRVNKKNLLPPNCDNKMYYKDIGVCKPDELCGRIRNPVNYAKKKALFKNKKNGRKRNKNTGDRKTKDNKQTK